MIDPKSIKHMLNASPSRSAKPPLRLRLVRLRTRAQSPRRRKVQSARARLGDRPGRRPVRLRQRLRLERRGGAPVGGQRAFALDQTARDIVGHGGGDGVGRLAFGDQHPAIAGVLKETIGALVVRHVDEGDYGENKRGCSQGARARSNRSMSGGAWSMTGFRALSSAFRRSISSSRKSAVASARSRSNSRLPDRGREVGLDRNVLGLVVIDFSIWSLCEGSANSRRLVDARGSKGHCDEAGRRRAADGSRALDRVETRRLERRMLVADCSPRTAIDRRPRLPITLKRPLAAATMKALSDERRRSYGFFSRGRRGAHGEKTDRRARIDNHYPWHALSAQHRDSALRRGGGARDGRRSGDDRGH